MKIYFYLILLVLSNSAFSRGSIKPSRPQPSRSKKNRSYYRHHNRTAASPCIWNVQTQLSRIRRYPRQVRNYSLNDRIFYWFGYRMNLFNKNTAGIENHFQGLVKLPGWGNFIFSGGDLKRREAHLFIMRNGRAVKKLIIAKGAIWHAGGISRAGDVLAVPIQTHKTGAASIVKFYDIKDPYNPRELYTSIRDNTIWGYDGVSLHRRSDGKYLLLQGNGIRISNSTNILDGFGPKMPLAGLDLPGSGFSLVRECRTNQLYVAKFFNNGKGAPILNGEDVVELFKIDMNWRAPYNPRSRKVKTYKFKCRTWQCNFSAGAALVKDPNSGLMSIYSIYHYRIWSGRKIPIAEFRR